MFALTLNVLEVPHLQDGNSHLETHTCIIYIYIYIYIHVCKVYIVTDKHLELRFSVELIPRTSTYTCIYIHMYIYNVFPMGCPWDVLSIYVGYVLSMLFSPDVQSST